MNFRPTGFLSVVIVSIMVLTGCKGSSGDDPIPQTSEQEKVTAILTSGTGTWSPSANNAILVEGIDVTEEFFSDFTIRFTTNQLFTTGTTPVWLRQDTWHFQSESSTIMIRGQDNKEVTIENISESELRISLDWAHTTFGGRTRSLPGRYTFVLNK